MFTDRPLVRVEPLNKTKLAIARYQRLREIQMWSIIRKIFTNICFVVLLSLLIYSNHQSNSFLEVQHLQKYFLNTREIDNNYLEVCFFLNLFD